MPLFQPDRWFKYWSVSVYCLNSIHPIKICCRLIAIMLGRLRMTVPDCLAEYRVLGQEVFGKPRKFPLLRVAVGKPRYRASQLEGIFKRVVRNRNEKTWDDGRGRINFPSRGNVCKTYALHPPAVVHCWWIS